MWAGLLFWSRRMTVFANIDLTTPTDGVPYCVNALLPGVEADLYNIPGLDDSPICIPYGHHVSADVLFTAVGLASDAGAYVVLQTDWGDGNWVDLTWANTTISGTTTDLFAFFVGDSADPNLVVHQTRQAGTTPTPSNSQNLIGLGGRFRFVGKAATTLVTQSSGSSIAEGLFVSIHYRLLGLR
jgi:hypothetical protein